MKIKRKPLSFSYILFLLLLLLPCLEISLRLLAYQPYQQQNYQIESKPKHCLIAHSNLGFALHPGRFDVVINQGLYYTVQHGIDSLRITSDNTVEGGFSDSIYFFGCSYTYGMGIDDSLSLPFLIQQQMPNSLIKNYAVPGYGTVQTYLQLKELIKKQQIPNTIIINYADFHDDRNALTPAYRRNLFLGYQKAHSSISHLMEEANIPYFTKTRSGYELAFCPWKDIYQNWKYRERFATVNFIQDIRDQRRTAAIDKEKVSLAVFNKIKKICDRHQIRMIVTGITVNKRTKNCLSQLTETGIETLDISLDLTLDKYRNAPFDDHPNSLAHNIFSQRIITYLTTFD